MISKQTRGRITLFLATLIISIFLLEITLRLTHPTSFGYIKGGVIPDTERCYALPANFSATIPINDPPYKTHFTTTPLGTRTTGQTIHNATILLLGDSYTQGIQVSDKQTFAAILSQRLETAGQKNTVINAGVLGYNPYQYLSTLNKTLQTTTPHTIIINFFMGNDFITPQEDSRNGCAMTVINGYLVTARPESRTLFYHLKLFLYHNLHTYNFITSYLLEIPFFNTLIHNLGLTLNKPDVPEALLYTNQGQDLIQNTLDILNQHLQLTTTAGAQLIIIATPPEYHADTELWQQFWQAHGTNDTPQQNLPYDALSTWSAQHNVTFIDMRPHLLKNYTFKKYYGKRDRHYSPAGHELHAQVLADTLLAKNNPSSEPIIREV